MPFLIWYQLIEVVCRRRNKGDESESSKSVSKPVLILELSFLKLWVQIRAVSIAQNPESWIAILSAGSWRLFCDACSSYWETGPTLRIQPGLRRHVSVVKNVPSLPFTCYMLSNMHDACELILDDYLIYWLLVREMKSDSFSYKRSVAKNVLVPRASKI